MQENRCATRLDEPVSFCCGGDSTSMGRPHKPVPVARHRVVQDVPKRAGHESQDGE